LPFCGTLDLIYCNSVLQWIRHRPRAYQSVFAGLKTGGWFVAQRPAYGNLRKAEECILQVMGRSEFRPYFSDWVFPWTHSSAEEVEFELRATGFSQIHVYIVATPMGCKNAITYATFLARGPFQRAFRRLPSDLAQSSMIQAVAACAEDQFSTLEVDYIRLFSLASRD
jgi:SAM-dependent methyltransferase